MQVAERDNVARAQASTLEEDGMNAESNSSAQLSCVGAATTGGDTAELCLAAGALFSRPVARTTRAGSSLKCTPVVAPRVLFITSTLQWPRFTSDASLLCPLMPYLPIGQTRAVMQATHSEATLRGPQHTSPSPLASKHSPCSQPPFRRPESRSRREDRKDVFHSSPKKK